MNFTLISSCVFTNSRVNFTFYQAHVSVGLVCILNLEFSVPLLLKRVALFLRVLWLNK